MTRDSLEYLESMLAIAKRMKKSAQHQHTESWDKIIEGWQLTVDNEKRWMEEGR